MVENIVRQWAKDYHYDDDAIKRYGRGNPRLVVVGEHHNNDEMKDQQMDLCVRLGPETVAHEMLDNYVYYPQVRMLRRNMLYPVHPSSNKCLSQVIEENQTLRKLCSAERYEKVMEESHDGYKEFREWRRKNNVGVLLNAFEQERFCSIFGVMGYRSGQNISKFPQGVKKIVGCDIDGAEKKYLIDSYLENGLVRLSFHQNDLTHIPAYHHRREERMAQVIADCLAGIKKPLLAVLGAYHIRENRKPEIGFIYNEWPAEDSWIHKSFAEMRIPYIVIDQGKSKAHSDFLEKRKQSQVNA